MNVEYINAFIEASQIVLRQMAGINAKLGNTYLKASPYQSDAVLIIVGLTGNVRGQVVFTMNKRAAMCIASGMMAGVTISELDEISKSAVTELTNTILGNTATILYNKGIKVEITPPSLLMGDNMEVTTNKMKTLCVPLTISNDNDIMEIDLSVIDN